MATRSSFIFNVSPYPGRNEPSVTAHVYNHWDGDPESTVEVILDHWSEALKRLSDDPDQSPHVPQVNAGQIIMGLMLADVSHQFRLVDDLKVTNNGYVYQFDQVEADAGSLFLTISEAGTRGEPLFAGGFEALETYWDEEL